MLALCEDVGDFTKVPMHRKVTSLVIAINAHFLRDVGPGDHLLQFQMSEFGLDQVIYNPIKIATHSFLSFRKYIEPTVNHIQKILTVPLYVYTALITLGVKLRILYSLKRETL